jgi:hypothetical protein
MAENARYAQSGKSAGQGQDASSGRTAGSRGSQQNEDMGEPTDTLTDRNLSGASTWATLDEADRDSQRADKDRSPKE